ncbi:hypothetical protein OK842_11640, partial [Streptococcus pneumoniae]|nr:hypothetical protein [Streptococcus pneumoniae]
DEAIEIARTRRLTINPRNGVAELSHAPAAVANPVPPAAVREAPASEDPRTLRARGFTLDDLTDIGMDADFAGGALDVGDEDQVIAYA